eukprot:1153404_1
MADAKEKEINEGNENNTQQQLIESLQNELRLASEQYQKVCIDLNIQIETNNEMMDELKTLRTKYDAMSCQKSSTFEEIISNQQNVNQLQELQLKYEESERENTQILQAMEMLIIESNKKNDGMRKEMEHQLNEAQLAHEEQMDELIQEKEDMTQQIKQLKELNHTLQQQNNDADSADTQNAYNALQQKYNELTLQLQALESKQTKCDQMKPNIKELWELRGREKEYKQRISDMNSKHDALKKELNEMRKTQKESIAKYKTKAKNAVHKHKGNAKKQINTMQQQMDDISHKYEQMIENIDSLTKQNEKLLLQNHELMAQNTILRDKYDALNKQSNDAMKECQSKTETSHIIEILQMECDQMKKQNQGLNRRMDELHQEYVDRNSNKSHELQTQYEALQSKHNASMSKYKEKAKNVVNKHKSNAKKEMSAMKQELNEMRTKYEECMKNIVLLTNKNQELVLKNEQLQSWQNNMSSNMMSLTHKMNSNQDDVNKLSGRCVALKQTNGKLESKIRAMMHDEEQFKRKLNDALSASLAQFRMSQTDDRLRIIEVIKTVLAKYETQRNKLKEKIKAMTASEKELQSKMHQMKQTMDDGINERNNILCNQLKNDLSSITTQNQELNQTLSSNQGTIDELSKSNDDLKNELQNKLKAQQQYQQSLVTNQHITDELSQVQKMNQELNRQLRADHAAMDKVSNQVMLLKQINDSLKTKMKGMLHNEQELKVKFESQNTMLNQMNQTSTHISTIQRQYQQSLTTNRHITDELDALKRQNRQLNQTLRSNQSAMDKLSNQVVIFKQKSDDVEDKIKSMMQNDWEVNAKLEAQTKISNKLQLVLHKISALLASCSLFTSTANDSANIIKSIQKLTQHYEQSNQHHIETIKQQLNSYEQALQRIHSESQQSIQKWNMFRHEFESIQQSNTTSHLDLISRCSADVGSLNTYFVHILDVYQQKKEAIKKYKKDINEKNDELMELKQRLLLLSVDNHHEEKCQEMGKENVQCEIGIQTDAYDVSSNNEDQTDMIAAFIDNIKNSKIKILYYEKIRGFEKRLKRLQELLHKSEQLHKRKNSQLQYLKTTFMSNNQSQDDMKKFVDNSEYLKSTILQYFEGNISVDQLLSVMSVGLGFNEEELRKAESSKLVMAQSGSGIGGYVKSWLQ